MPPFRLEGRVAWVTGGVRGIGAAVAEKFLEAGAKVAVMDIDREAVQSFHAEMAARSSGTLKAYEGNVCDESSVSEVAQAVERELGPVDILVNNAGIIRDRMFRNMSLTDWQTVLDVNLTGAFVCTKAVIDGMVERRYGRIINTSSISSLGNVGQANYTAAKAGVIGLTKTLALEYAPYGVTVNCVAPGATLTEMTRAIPVEAKQRFLKKIPMARMAEPEEIAIMHLFFASEEARYVTGQVVFVDGGISIGF
ncbi:MAG: 3-oxoacyl-ACP reductase [Deltaproteobacteria bacterium]|nr:MAG: 3-oxoacyl-ACP reductase [Deltaproteobacteria bacterium]